MHRIERNLSVARLMMASTLSALLGLSGPSAAQTYEEPAIIAGHRLSAIDRVWSGHEVKYAILEDDRRIYVGYYDANRQLTLASRSKDDEYWIYHKLESWTGWDSHNYIALGLDPAGNLHVAANMHNDPVAYWRTTRPGEIRSAERQKVLVDAALEQSMTYPVFLKDADGNLIYKYRDGGSGRGNEIYVAYDAGAQSFRHLLKTPLVDGEGERNAYFVGPTLGPDGWFHTAWVWRDTPDAATNHDLSYAKSRDLVNWTRADGTPFDLPIRLSSAEIVDAVKINEGMINNNTVVGFDAKARPIITYHRFDAAGNTQIFLARSTGDAWQVVQATDWTDFRWEFGGGGSLVFRLSVKGAFPEGDHLVVPIVRDDAAIDLIVDSETLKVTEERPSRKLTEDLAGVVDAPEGHVMQSVSESWSGAAKPYALVWPTRPTNRDLPRLDVSEPTVLRLAAPERTAE